MSYLLDSLPISSLPDHGPLDRFGGSGTFEDRLSEFNAVLGPHLSQNDCWKNDASLVMALLAFTLSSLLSLELEASHGGSWDLVRHRDCVMKAGGRITKHGHRMVVKLAKALSAFWSTLSARVARWRLPITYPKYTRVTTASSHIFLASISLQKLLGERGRSAQASQKVILSRCHRFGYTIQQRAR